MFAGRLRGSVVATALLLTACGTADVMDQAVPDVRNRAAVERTARALPPPLADEFGAYVSYARNNEPLFAQRRIVTVRDAIEAQREARQSHDREIEALRQEIRQAGAARR